MAAIAGAAAWPRSGAGQSAPQRRIGVLTSQSDDDAELRRWLAGFVDALRDLGWVEGRDVRLQYRAAATDLDRLSAYAAELVGLKPDVILAHTTPATGALRRASDSVPIVFVTVADPIGSGFVESFARPGANVTGFTNYDAPMGGKWLELLKEIAPRTECVGMLFNPETAASGATGGVYRRSIEGAAEIHGLKLIASPVHEPADIDRAVAALAREPGAGMLVMPNAFTIMHRERITAAAAGLRVPAVYPLRTFAAAGGLMAYGADVGDIFRRAATYVDRVLKGSRPGELPVQAPTKFELVINAKAAGALGLTVPPTLVARADEVIE